MKILSDKALDAQVRKEVASTLLLTLICALWHVITAFALNKSGLYFLGMPAWFSVSVLGTILIAIIGVVFLCKKVFVDFEYPSEAAGSIAGAGEAGRAEGARGLAAERSFFIGGRDMGGLVLAMTTMATYTSVSSFISGPGAAGLTYGYAQAWIAAVQVPVTFLVLGVLGNSFANIARKTGAVTVSGYLKARYKSDALVIVTSLLMVAFFIAQMIAQFQGGATLIESVFGLEYKKALLVFGLIVILYTSFGGFKAVALTDAVQGLIMCFGTIIFVVLVLKNGGGLEAIDLRLGENLPDIYDNLTAIYRPGTLLSYWVLVGFGTVGLPQTAVRCMGFKNTQSLKRAMLIGVVCCSLVMVGMHTAGVWAGALINIGGQGASGAAGAGSAALPSSDYFIPYIIQKIMPGALGYIFLLAPAAAVMSTADSLLLLASAAIVKDLYKTYIVKDNPVKLERYNRNVKKITSLSTLVFGIIVVLLATDPPSIIFFLNLFAMGGLECSFFWPLVGGVFTKNKNARSAIAASIGGVAIYIFCYYNVNVLGINAVVWGLLGSGLLYFIF